MAEDDVSRWIPALMDMVVRAGEAIMEVRQTGPEVATKADRSPVTEADHRAQALILAGLRNISPRVPVISEEGRIPPLVERAGWHRVWLVDPLDGTRSFIRGEDTFAINVALIAGGKPVMGIIHQPVTGDSFVAHRESISGTWVCFRRTKDGETLDLGTRRFGPADDQCLRVVVSRQYGDDDIGYLPQSLKQSFPRVDVVRISSAVKFCHMAAGEADFYVRNAPTCEWDTAAGQALLEATGGGICDFAGKPLIYNCRDTLLNPGFYAYGPALADRSWL